MGTLMKRFFMAANRCAGYRCGQKRFVVYLFSTLLMFFCVSVQAADIYVSPAGGGSGTMGDPTDLQTSLDTARTNGENDTIYLQTGTYDVIAGPFSYGTASNDNMAVTLSGGWNTDFTTQSDDPLLTMVDGGGTSRVIEILADAPGVNITFDLENLTIQNGFSSTTHGAGIRAYTGVAGDGTIDLEISECVLKNNVVSGSIVGGGMYSNCYFEVHDALFASNSAGSGGAMFIGDVPGGDRSLAPVIDNTVFEDNRSTNWQGSTLFNYVSPIINGCTFTGRYDGSSSGPGGTIYSQTDSSLTVTDSVFSDNKTDYWGSAIQIWNCDATLTNVFFINNKAGGDGGTDGYGAIDIYIYEGSHTVNITNSTFTGNRSKYASSRGGAIHNRGLNSTVTGTNCIFWDNGPLGVFSQSNTFTINHSDVDNGFAGTGVIDGGNNIDADPEFIGTGDYHLDYTSPCIDTGDNNAPQIALTDFEGDSRVIDGDNDSTPTVDMGADEFISPVFETIYSDACISSYCMSTLSVTTYDPMGGGLTYAWEALDGGTIIGSGDTVSFDPPGPMVYPDCIPFRIKVAATSDASGLTTEEIIDVRVKLAGDVDGDGVVNILDKVEVRNAFGQSGDPGWINADADCNGVVNILDKVIIRNQFGQTGCACP